MKSHSCNRMKTKAMDALSYRVLEARFCAILGLVEPFRFECIPACTRCCRERGFVYMTEDDLRRAAAFLNLSPAAFERKYVYRTRRLLRLRKPPIAQCPFLEDQGCAIHPAKPAQCAAYPFWPEMISDRAAWKEAAACCPGIGAGPLIQIEAVHRIAAELGERHPNVFGD